MTEKTDGDSLGAAMLDRNDGSQAYRGVPNQTEPPFMCIKHGKEEAVKHPMADGKYVKAQYFHKSVPRIIK